ncbi:hypothetical protein FNH08_22075 [Streptomyces spongiae]|uniref:Uncharacterized protein n=1 Tax=Streptomyces spongiae TaxID=565072 RepID=A0A5N8XJW3_9ACTN|nr:hypothetical protein [Streptomyces spongiae]
MGPQGATAGEAITDHLLGILGDPKVMGKPVGADLAVCKKTLPVLSAMASITLDGDVLIDLYSSGDLMTANQVRQTGRCSAGAATGREVTGVGFHGAGRGVGVPGRPDVRIPCPRRGGNSYHWLKRNFTKVRVFMLMSVSLTPHLKGTNQWHPLLSRRNRHTHPGVHLIRCPSLATLCPCCVIRSDSCARCRLTVISYGSGWAPSEALWCAIQN